MVKPVLPRVGPDWPPASPPLPPSVGPVGKSVDLASYRSHVGTWLCRKWHELAGWGYALRWLQKANTASAMAIRVMALSAPVSMAILTDMAPTSAKAAATAVAARNGMNMGVLSGLVVKG